MRRGTTPTLVFTVPFNTEILSGMYLTLKQKRDAPLQDIVVEKILSDATLTKNTISISLSQQETLGFDADLDILIQMRVKYLDGGVDASNIIITSIGRILKEGVI